MINVTVLHNADFPSAADAADPGESDEPPRSPDYSHDDLAIRARADVELAAVAVTRALATFPAFQVNRVGVNSLAEVAHAIRERRPGLVFNLCESLEGRADFEPAVAAVLERHRVAYTGNPPRALLTCLRKSSCNAALRAASVAVPATWRLVPGKPLPAGIEYPVIVKPDAEDGSTGIHSRSVVHDARALAAIVAELRETIGGPIIVQRYIEGREINIALLGQPLRALPLSEIDFGKLPAELPRIVAYAAKWHPDSPEWNGCASVAADVGPTLAARLADIARRTGQALGLRDYARIDVRVDARGRPWVIDVNPNCDISPDAGFALAAARGGIDYPRLVHTIALAARARAAVPRQRAIHARRRVRRSEGSALGL